MKKRLQTLQNHFVPPTSPANDFTNIKIEACSGNNKTSGLPETPLFASFPVSENLKISSSEEGKVLWVTFNRPQKLNALSFQFRRDLHLVLDWLGAHEEVRLVVLRGEGRGFCAGLDLDDALERSMKDGVLVQTPQSIYRDQREFAGLMIKLRKLPQVVVALLHGPAVGGGFALALACDIRIATKDCKMNCAMINLGLGGADLGLSYFLPRLVGWSIAAELLLTGAYIQGERAEKVGLVSRVVDNVADLEAAANEIIEKALRISPLGLRVTKQALHFSMDSPSIDTVTGVEDRNQALCSITKDSQEAVAAFFARRKPEYQDS